MVGVALIAIGVIGSAVLAYAVASIIAIGKGCRLPK